jgi:hypothetical protein
MSDIYAVRIKEHRGNEISAPSWRVGYWLRFRPEDHECIGPGGGATYEAVEKPEHASFGSKRDVGGIINFMAQRYPFVVCEIKRYVQAADAIA